MFSDDSCVHCLCTIRCRQQLLLGIIEFHIDISLFRKHCAERSSSSCCSVSESSSSSVCFESRLCHRKEEAHRSIVSGHFTTNDGGSRNCNANVVDAVCGVRRVACCDRLITTFIEFRNRCQTPGDKELYCPSSTGALDNLSVLPGQILLFSVIFTVNRASLYRESKTRFSNLFVCNSGQRFGLPNWTHWDRTNICPKDSICGTATTAMVSPWSLTRERACTDDWFFVESLEVSIYRTINHRDDM